MIAPIWSYYIIFKNIFKILFFYLFKITLCINLASFIFLISKVYALPSSDPTVKFIGSIGFHDKACDLFGNKILCNGVSPLTSYKTILLSIPVPASICSCEGLYLIFKILSAPHSNL